MELLSKISLAVLVSFTISIMLSPLIIALAHKIKFNQPLYEYVTMHTQKTGTPTMGGLIFILGIFFSFLMLINWQNKLATMSILTMLGFGIIGFLDDFIKVHYKHNEGLKPYQKIIGQLAISVIVSIFAYHSNLVGTSVIIPFVNTELDLKFLFIPFCILFFVAITNSVNLTDGLDGLAGGVTLSYLITFGITFYIIFKNLNGATLILEEEYKNLIILFAISVGSMLAYLMYNTHPATIFMGDTGSLALGGLLGSLAIFTKMSLFVPIIGAMFVTSAVSVILQVFHFKLTHKRIFLMAPLHHHFEKKGMYETKIVAIYIIITAILGIVTILLTTIT